MSHRLVSGFELEHELMSRSLTGSSAKEEGEEEEEDGLLSGGVAGSEYLVRDDIGGEAACFLGPTDGDGPERKRFRADDVREDDVEHLPIKGYGCIRIRERANLGIRIYLALRVLRLEQLLRVIHRAIVGRLNAIERKVDTVSLHCRGLEQKVNAVEEQLRLQRPAGTNDSLAGVSSSGTALFCATQKLLLTPNGKMAVPYCSNGAKLVTLNSEEDFPEGTWLGDAGCPHRRVRCHISSGDLKTVEETCHTPEKMALTLLDFLFDRETQACSNISGQGKQGKKQLDPLFVFGIRCHLQKRFSIGDTEWQRIKTNLDSKCRTAHRRKVLGMPLLVKAFKDKVASTVLPVSHPPPSSDLPNDYNRGGCPSQAGSSCGTPLIAIMDDAEDFEQAHRHFAMVVGDDRVPPAILVSDDNDPCSVLLRNNHADPEAGGNPVEIASDGAEEEEERQEGIVGERGSATCSDLGFEADVLAELNRHSEVLRTLQGDIRVLQATPEQLLEIQRTGKIQILTREDLLGFPESVFATSVLEQPGDDELETEAPIDRSDLEDASTRHVITAKMPEVFSQLL